MLEIQSDRRGGAARPLSPQELHEAMLTSTEALVGVDESRRIAFFNEGAERLFGFRRDEVLGRPLQLLVADRARARQRRAIMEFARSDDHTRFLGRRGDLIARRKGGEEFIAEGSISRSGSGGRCTCILLLRDVTDRAREEREQTLLAHVGVALADSLDCATTVRAFARLMADRFADMCVVRLRDDETFGARLVVSHNDRAIEDFAVDHFASAEGPCLDLLTKALDTGDPVLVQQDRAPSTEPVPVDACPTCLVGGRAACLAVPLQARGRSIGAVLFVSSAPGGFGPRDVELARELAGRAALAIENDRLYAVATRTLQAHDEMLSFVSHDLRNPLNVIKMSAQLVGERAAGRDASAARWIEAISRAADQMEALIGDLLTAARSSSGRTPLHRRESTAGQVIREAAATLEMAAERKGVGLDVRCPDPDLDIMVDLDAVERAVANLIGNAVKFTPPGGTVVVSAEREGDDALFSVADTGPGIHEEHLPHIFDRFWQAPETQRGGTGLGLAIVKGVAEAHGGRVRVETERGRGSTFHLAIPLRKEG